MRQYTEPSQHHLHLLTSRILNKAKLFCVLGVSAGVLAFGPDKKFIGSSR